MIKHFALVPRRLRQRYQKKSTENSRDKQVPRDRIDVRTTARACMAESFDLVPLLREKKALA